MRLAGREQCGEIPNLCQVTIFRYSLANQVAFVVRDVKMLRIWRHLYGQLN